MSRTRLGVVVLAIATLATGWLVAATETSSSQPRPHERTVTLDLRYSRFTPAELELRRGTTVRFVVRNRDPIAHELIVGDERVQDVHERGTEAHHGERPGEVSVAPGGTATTTYTFSRPGRVLLGCHLPGHWDYGMRGVVNVR